MEVASVHNYYERIVTETIANSNSRALDDADFMADVSCVALNHLPPKYIRHDVDMSFFMSPVEREEITNKVQQAVDHAIAFVLAHEKQKQDQEIDEVVTTSTNDDESDASDKGASEQAH
jgi:hypothetical protein